MLTIAAIVAALVVAAGIAFCFAYWPLRKYVYIKTNRAWNDLARLYEFSPELEAREEADLFVSATVMRDACDVIWHEEVAEPPAALFGPLRHGTVVHINAKHVGAFIEKVLPRLETEIVLVSGFDDVTTRVPGYEALLESEKILHWFLQNFELDPGSETKVAKLPIGLNYHKLEPDGSNTSIDMGLPARPGNQQLTMKAIAETIPPLRARPARIYANFQLNMDTFLRSEEAKKRRRARQQALDALEDKDFVYLEPRQTPRHEVWRRHRDFAFEASPQGNGLDCHRTWEALLLKTVPIVTTSPLDSLFDGLPVAIVEDWREIDRARLEAWQRQFENSFDGAIPEQLYSRHWIERFRSFAAPGAGS